MVELLARVLGKTAKAMVLFPPLIIDLILDLSKVSPLSFLPSVMGPSQRAKEGHTRISKAPVFLALRPQVHTKLNVVF